MVSITADLYPTSHTHAGKTLAIGLVKITLNSTQQKSPAFELSVLGLMELEDLMEIETNSISAPQ